MDPERIEQLLAGRAVVDQYLEANKEFHREWKAACVGWLRDELQKIGFSGPEELYRLDTDLSIAELCRCVKIYHKETGEENPLCDGCIGRHRRGCDYHPVTGELLPKRVTCGNTRFDAGQNQPTSALVIPSDPIYRAQIERMKQERRVAGIAVTMQDIMAWWPYNGPCEPCIIVGRYAVEPRFDPWWRLRERWIK